MMKTCARAAQKCSLTGTFVAGSGNGFRRLQIARREALAARDHCHDKLFFERYRVCVMQGSKWDLDTTTDNDAGDVPWQKSPEQSADQFGIRIALLVLCMAFFIAAIWFVSSPSFEKCSAVDNVMERNACYEAVRKELLKPPAKGADVPHFRFGS
jgi:hypothetical protein